MKLDRWNANITQQFDNVLVVSKINISFKNKYILIAEIQDYRMEVAIFFYISNEFCNNERDKLR